MSIFARLTTAGQPRRIEVMSRLWRVTVVAALMSAVSSSGWASCLPGEMTDKADMACCQKMRACDQTMKAVDCCQAPAKSPERLVALKPASVVKPLAIVSFGSGLSDMTVPARINVAAYDRSLAAPSSPPIFQLDTSLRI